MKKEWQVLLVIAWRSRTKLVAVETIIVLCLEVCPVQKVQFPSFFCVLNVITGHPIPAGTGLRDFENMIVGSKEEYELLQTSREAMQFDEEE